MTRGVGDNAWIFLGIENRIDFAGEGGVVCGDGSRRHHVGEEVMEGMKASIDHLKMWAFRDDVETYSRGNFLKLILVMEKAAILY